MARNEKYAWSTTEVGDWFEVLFSAKTLAVLRSAAGHQSRANERHFQVQARGDVIRVTRVATADARKVAVRDSRPWDEIGVDEWFDVMRTECTLANISALTARRNKGSKAYYLHNMADRWRIYRTR